ncbi:hypothetical protein METBIDRAFT_32940 [Metschnikowia bicuspidata var. bicuspidata NRRL YB-4993]|uniref:C2H2-type domain-containing protein n=1 Tax=Metschnikowia bicuspidata var. bicuspidata NRRL YB-4993 TaxID=869754 RepID=A0A1A0H7B4_9ASCO|nr:hypothetical protein METBIDRAFT_32940 [Metschnikowia bicuspidata var. bicuspidata NRRL YB-4993]OBA19916.1 hypothetical protein METBIDRAFT_32940 [Metschnikowia bicuspidata var. bicuspidata NRRL YB-4993]
MNYLPQGSNPTTAGFTCNTCGIRFLSAEIQRQHMKTEWHRYNLKRKVAGLPGILSEVFAEKVLASQKSADEEPADEDELGFHINHRRRSGKGERQLTKKDLKQLARGQVRGRITVEDIPSILQRSQSPAASVASEFSEFSLGESVNLSEVESTVDTNSEINYSDDSEWSLIHESDEDSSGTDIEEDHFDEEATHVLPNHYCFYCGKNNHEIEQNIKHMTNRHALYIPERSFLVDLAGLLTFINEVVTVDHDCLVCGFDGKSLESIRLHLTSKGHCRIPYETEEAREVVAEFYNFDTVDRQPLRINSMRKKKSVAFRPASDDSEYEDIGTREDVEDATSDVVLPNGSVIGHRAMVRQQRPNRPMAREWNESERTVALVDRRFAPGLTDFQVSKQEKEMRKLEAKARNVHERMTKPRRVNFQRHFRDEMLGHS